MDSAFHTADLNGCEYAMSILNEYENNITSSYHTEGEKDRYDMDWTLTDGTKLRVEGKDRKVNFKTKEPQYVNTYPTIMFNVEKYENMMSTYEVDDIYPVYAASYTDGLVLYGLPRLPREEIEAEVKDVTDTYNATGERKTTKWVGWYLINKTTVEESEKRWQIRLKLPKPTWENNYGKILWRYDDDDE